MNNLTINTDFSDYKKCFLELNAKLNLISKNDEKYLYEKHIYDSLSIKLFFDKYNIKSANILDIGCGGGFPSVPIALEYPQFQVTGIDSIQKKINAINELKQNLNIINLHTICDRVEKLNGKKFDIITSRAVADLSKIAEYALPLLNKQGYFIAYKSKKAQEEITNAKPILNKYNAIINEIITYTLPLDETYERNLIVIKIKH